MSTQILLLEDVEHVGLKGDIKVVKSGYAYNFLVPQGFALIATPAAIRKQSKLQQERAQKAVEDKNESEAIALKLNGEAFETEVKVDHEGHMYGSVTVLDILGFIQTKLGIQLEKKSVQLAHPIKETGAFDITLRLKEGVTAQIHLKVMPEQAFGEL